MIRSKPLISVIMSVYNSEEYLRESINSILNQTYSNIEFIIVNDGSTDKSIDILKEYQKKDKRVLIINQKNKGLTKSLNIAIKLSSGSIIARQDADDISLIYRFEKQVYFINEKKYDLCCSRTILLPEKRISPILSYYLPTRILIYFKNPFIHGTFMIKRSGLQRVNCYDETFYFAQDFKLIHDFYKNNLKIKYLKEPLYVSRKPTSSISVLKKKDQNLSAKRLTII